MQGLTSQDKRNTALDGRHLKWLLPQKARKKMLRIERAMCVTHKSDQDLQRYICKRKNNLLYVALNKA